MTISQISAQLQLAWTKWGICGKLANRLWDRSSSGKDADHAKPICASDCLKPRSPKPLAGFDPSPFHPASFGLSLPADLAVGSRGSAFQSSSCQRMRL
jgi:hypothetical protein